MGLMDWIKNLFGGKGEEQSQESAGGVSEQPSGEHDVSSENQTETAANSEEERPQQ